MNKTLKIITILLMAILLICSISNSYVYAATGTQLNPGDLNDKIDYGDDQGLANKAGQIMGMIRNISVIAAVIIIMVLGVKFMLGSVEEKAEYKKSFIPLIIGIICVVAATTIASFIFNMAD